jgi:hypothetical protein
MDKQTLIEKIRDIQLININATHTLYEKTHDAKIMREVSDIYFDMQRNNKLLDELLFTLRNEN